MPQPELVATANAANSNSLATLEEAEAYFSTRLNVSLWSALPNDDAKKLRLMAGTLRLEQERYVGARTTTTQALKWGRTGAYGEDGEELDPDTVPVAVKWALFEQVLYELSQGTTDLTLPTGLEPFKRLETTTVKLEMRDRPQEELSGLAPAVLRLLGDLLVTYDVLDADLSPGTFRIERA